MGIKEGPLKPIPADLAPGDRQDQRLTQFNWKGFDVVRVTDSEDPLFEKVFNRFWKEFGPQGELEQKEVLVERLKWNPSQVHSGISLGYEIIVIRKDKTWVAARDHTAIVLKDRQPMVVVHLSHVLIEPTFRGMGLAGWLRAFPIQKARACLKEAGCPETAPIILVAEMEPLSHPIDPAHGGTKTNQEIRLRSYQKAGFLMVNPAQVHYLQPDFRSPSEIDASGGPKPLPLNLIMRQVRSQRQVQRGEKENDGHVSGEMVSQIVAALYKMYERTFRKKDMDLVWRHWQTHGPKSKTERIDLVDPTFVAS